MIERLSQTTDRAGALLVLETIFYEASSRQTFASADERRAFLRTWTGWYIEHAPQDVLLWRDENSVIAGYLTGCRDSVAAHGLHETNPRYAEFADQFAEFPAHLHVNCRADYRGRGIGAQLVEAFAADVRHEGCGGTHIVTAANARNIRFYARCGFTHRVLRDGLLFMGRRLV